jgi:membrane protein implicated in regulation of membrane protease activity
MLDFLFDWSSLGIAEKVFAGIGVAALVLTVLQTLLSLIGGAGDHDFEVSEADGGSGHAWGLLSIRGMFGYMLGLGWGGIIALRYGLGVIPATLLGSVLGVLIALGLALLMRAVYSLRSDGTVQLENAIGQTGTVYQRIPAERDGFGKVQIIVQGRLQTLEAVTDSPTDLKAPKQVRVVAVVSGNLLLVEGGPLTPAPAPVATSEK